MSIKSNKKMIAIIPARGGSKGIHRKNIINLGGYPLIAYSIVVAKLSKLIDRVVVSTDDQEIANIAKQYGAEVPFLRPQKFAEDSSPDIDFVVHALNWFKENENFQPEYLIHLRPTTPLRDPAIVDKAIEDILHNQQATSLRSAHVLRESPHKFFEIKNGFFTGLFPDDKNPDSQNAPRQAFSPVYQPNGYVDVLKTQIINEFSVMHGDKILPFITDEIIELDEVGDLKYLDFDLQQGNYHIYKYLKDNFKTNGN